MNFWKCVLVALILGFVFGVTGGASGGISTPQLTEKISSEDFGIEENDDGTVVVGGEDTELTPEDITGIILVVGGTILIIFVICAAIGLVFHYLLLKPIRYGCRKFFRKNLEEPAKIRNVFYAFGSNYKNIVKTAFMTDLSIFLWSLLFVVPGIIKFYEYCLVPYIMSENPTMNYKDAKAESKKLMKGNKWKKFVLDLSFIGWKILSWLTLGVLGVFFVDPYVASTDAALYESIMYGINAA